jgi:HSP20 family protein
MNAVINEETETRETSRPTQATVAPQVNVFETKDGYTLEAEIPGVGRDGVDISVNGNELTILARRQPEDATLQPLYRESADADFRRVFELDPAIDAAKITATVEQGVLTVHLPYSEQVKPRKIAITE